MFGKIKQSVFSFTSSLAEKIKTKEIKEEDVEDALQSLMIDLVQSDVAYSTAEAIIAHLKASLVGKKIDKKAKIEEIVNQALIDFIEKNVVEPNLDIFTSINEKFEKTRKPYIVMFMGINGVGKTTSIAKLAYKLKSYGIVPLIVAADTFRAGSQEQLEIHANRLSVPIVKGKYNSDPASVVFDGLSFAEKRQIKAVLIDTAGRMHVDKDLINQLKKISSIANSDLKILVIDALTGNDAIEQAKAYNENIGIDGFFLTKTDADTKGGVALSISFETKKPIFFIGTGQRYEDMEFFTKKWLIKTLISS